MRSLGWQGREAVHAGPVEPLQLTPANVIDSKSRTRKVVNPINAFLSRFSAWALALATIGGLYLSALSLNLLPAFWVLMGAAIIIAVIPLLGRKLFNLGLRLWDYPRIQQKLDEALEEVEQLQVNIERGAEQIAAARELGLREGHAQSRGTILAFSVEVPIVYAAINDGGNVALAAKCRGEKLPERGARYFVIEAITGEIKGIVQVSATSAGSIEPSSGVILNVVEPTSGKFWQHLAQRVEYDTTAPPGIELRRYGMYADIDDKGRLVKHAKFGLVEHFDEIVGSDESGLEAI